MNATKVQARKMVLASMLILALVSTYRDRNGSAAAGQQGTFRVFWGVGVVGLFLSLLADFLPEIAGPFAVLVALGSLTHGGDTALAKLLGTVTPVTQTAGSSAARPASRLPTARPATPQQQQPAKPGGGTK